MKLISWTQPTTGNRLGSTTDEANQVKVLADFGIAGDTIQNVACGFDSTAVYFEDESLYVGGGIGLSSK